MEARLCLATEPEDDSGLAHSLEHLIFQVQGATTCLRNFFWMDLLFCRCLTLTYLQIIVPATVPLTRGAIAFLIPMFFKLCPVVASPQVLLIVKFNFPERKKSFPPRCGRLHQGGSHLLHVDHSHLHLPSLHPSHLCRPHTQVHCL